MAGLVLMAGSAEASTTYAIDTDRTYAMFHIGYMQFASVDGRIDATGGRLTMDREGDASGFTVELDPATVATGDAGKDQRLRGDRFFAVAKYPAMRFTSHRIVFDPQDADRATVHGQLTLHGVTRPVVLQVTDIDCDDDNPAQAGHDCRMTANAEIERSQYGMDAAPILVSNDVAISVRLVAHSAGLAD